MLKIEHSNIISAGLVDQLMIIKIREESVKFENDFFRKYVSKKVALNIKDSLELRMRVKKILKTLVDM